MANTQFLLGHLSQLPLSGSFLSRTLCIQASVFSDQCCLGVQGVFSLKRRDSLRTEEPMMVVWPEVTNKGRCWNSKREGAVCNKSLNAESLRLI